MGKRTPERRVEQRTCEPDGAASEASPLAEDLSSLGAGHVLGLVRDIGGSLDRLQDKTTPVSVTNTRQHQQ